MKKKKTDREAVSKRLILTKEEPFDTFKAQLLQRILEGLHPAKLVFSDYKITYVIKRTGDGSITLKDEDDYKFLLDRAESVSNPEIIIIVEEAPKVCVRSMFIIN